MGALAASGGVLAGAEALRRARKRSHSRHNEELGRNRWRIERHHVKQDLHDEARAQSRPADHA